MKKSAKITIFTLFFFVLGIAFGICFKDVVNKLSFIGEIYINLLKFMIIPLISTNIIVSIYKSKKDGSKIAFKTIILFILMFIVSFLITSILVFLINPAIGFTFKEVNWSGNIATLSLSQFLINIFPNNIGSMFTNNSILACIIVSFAIGIVANKTEYGDKVIDLFIGLKNIFNKILEYIIYLTPIAVFSLVGTTIINYGTIVISSSIKYILVAYLSCFIVMIVVMILPVFFYAKIKPFNYIKKACKIWIMTLSTCSSAATLPYTIKICNEEFKIPEKITNIVVPLGCSIHMCGGAVSFALLGLFSATLFGIEISIGMFIFMLLLSTIINMAAPGMPGGGIVLGATYLSLLGVPLSFIGVYSGIYRLLDMAYTTMNVTGDITANILIAKSEKTI